MSKRGLVLGLGNPILSDDSIGLKATKRVKTLLPDEVAKVLDFKENYSCGLDLLEEIDGYSRVMIVDSIRTEQVPPGTCLDFTLASLETVRYDRFVSTHGLNLPTLWKLAEKLNYSLPAECLIWGIEGRDFEKFSEELSRDLGVMFDSIVSNLIDRITSWFQPEIQGGSL